MYLALQLLNSRFSLVSSSMSSSVLTRIADRASVADCDKGDFIVEKRLQPLIVLPRALDTAAVVINVSEGWKYVKADSVHCGKDVSEGLSLMEVEENDCNDTPVCDDIAHKVVS